MPPTPSAPQILALACGLAFALPAVAQVTLADPWVRGTVTGQKATGAFMQLKSTVDTALVGAASPVAKIVEIHEMKMDAGVMKMSAIDKLPVTAGKTVELKPGGSHVMLMDLTQQLKEGESVPITLSFVDKGGKKTTVEVQAPVKPLGAAPAAKP